MRDTTGAAAGAGIGGFFLGMLTGAVVAGIVTLLIAPRSGRETRDLLRGKARETQHMVQQKVSGMKEKAGKIRDTMRSRAEEEMQSAEKNR